MCTTGCRTGQCTTGFSFSSITHRSINVQSKFERLCKGHACSSIKKDSLDIGCPLGFVRVRVFAGWKRNAFLAALCILIPRATDNVTTFIHIQKYALGRPVIFTRSLLFAVAFMSLFSTVIALSKDMEDVDGDRDHGIQSLAVIIGKEKVFWLCISMLLIGYGCAMAIGASSSFLTSKLVTVLGHCVLASTLWLRARSVDLENNASISSFYMFIWKLVYAEYLLIPFIR
ncbi:hypothetical protein Vadar_020575 [Vaccinium darrowii]|uniref:Uncharacterized protein n=1 Tax=Vaccinium darrowii TaxID=229202 RepID=A0ACB7YXD2_9ERIC|nr:hypothetical protein Vadar_020575 [Vaccinium darrowii]